MAAITAARSILFCSFYMLPMVSGTIGMTATGTGLVGYINPQAKGKAVYDTATDVTWALDADLAASKHFGLTGTLTITNRNQVITVPLINASGAMLLATANDWLIAANNTSYAGTSNWVSPTQNDLQTLFNHLNLQPGDSRLTAQGSIGPFQKLQPFFYWACERDQTGNSQSPCNGTIAGINAEGNIMEPSFNLDNGFEGTDEETKTFYVEVYYPPPKVFLPMILR